MPIIYFDNFRGFPTTFLPLREVNFFVGENSSGKTSILKLIGILSSQSFWRYGEFGNDETGLGGFTDIITSTSENKDYFELGILGDSDHSNETSNPVAVKLRFIEQDNYPLLKEICYCYTHLNMQVIVEGQYLKFRHQIMNKTIPAELENFSSWIHDNQLNDLPFSRAQFGNSGIIPILAQLNVLIGPDLSTQSPTFLLVMQQPILLTPFAFISPIRASPQRTYHSKGLIFNPSMSHSFSVLKEILKGPDVKKIINRFGADSGLFDDIDISINELTEDKNDLNSFQIIVHINGIGRNIVNVGFGISQILPIVIEAIAREDHTWFATQQPEVHLHPRAQAAFGDFIFKSNNKDHQKFIIETHSDYIIDRFRLRLNRSFQEGDKGTGDKGQIVFFGKSFTGNFLELITFTPEGAYPEEQPKAFRDFFINEQMDLISI